MPLLNLGTTYTHVQAAQKYLFFREGSIFTNAWCLYIGHIFYRYYIQGLVQRIFFRLYAFRKYISFFEELGPRNIKTGAFEIKLLEQELKLTMYLYLYYHNLYSCLCTFYTTNFLSLLQIRRWDQMLKLATGIRDISIQVYFLHFLQLSLDLHLCQKWYRGSPLFYDKLDLTNIIECLKSRFKANLAHVQFGGLSHLTNPAASKTYGNLSLVLYTIISELPLLRVTARSGEWDLYTILAPQLKAYYISKVEAPLSYWDSISNFRAYISAYPLQDQKSTTLKIKTWNFAHGFIESSGRDVAGIYKKFMTIKLLGLIIRYALKIVYIRALCSSILKKERGLQRRASLFNTLRMEHHVSGGPQTFANHIATAVFIILDRLCFWVIPKTVILIFGALFWNNAYTGALSEGLLTDVERTILERGDSSAQEQRGLSRLNKKNTIELISPLHRQENAQRCKAYVCYYQAWKEYEDSKINVQKSFNSVHQRNIQIARTIKTYLESGPRRDPSSILGLGTPSVEIVRSYVGPINKSREALTTLEKEIQGSRTQEYKSIYSIFEGMYEQMQTEESPFIQLPDPLEEGLIIPIFDTLGGSKNSLIMENIKSYSELCNIYSLFRRIENIDDCSIPFLDASRTGLFQRWAPIKRHPHLPEMGKQIKKDAMDAVFRDLDSDNESVLPLSGTRDCSPLVWTKWVLCAKEEDLNSQIWLKDLGSCELPLNPSPEESVVFRIILLELLQLQIWGALYEYYFDETLGGPLGIVQTYK